MYYNSTTNKKEYFARTKKNKMPGEYQKKIIAGRATHKR